MNRFVLSCLILFFFLYGVDINKLLAEQTKTNIAQDISLLRVKTREISQLYKKYEPTEKKEVRQQIEQQIKQLQQEENQIKERLVTYGEKVIPEIIKSLETVTEKDGYFAETLVNVLQEIGEPSLPAVLTALKKAKSTYEKIVFLSFFNVDYKGKIDKDVIDVIKKFLNDKNPDVRKETVEILGRAGEDTVVILCEQLLKEKNEEIRESILYELESTKSKLALPYLEKILHDPTLRASAVVLISEITGESTSSILSRLYSQKKIDKKELRRWKEEITKSNLSRLRTALNIYYADNDGVYPENLESLVPKYISHIPEVDLGIDGFPVTNKVTYGKQPDNTGGWIYCNDKNDPYYGSIIVNCTEKDSLGNVWSSY